MSNISLFTGIHTNQMVVWGFFHQLYFSDGKIRRFKVLFQGQNWLSEVKFQELLLMKRSNKLILHTWKPWFLVKSCCGVRYGQMCVCVCVLKLAQINREPPPKKILREMLRFSGVGNWSSWSLGDFKTHQMLITKLKSFMFECVNRPKTMSLFQPTQRRKMSFLGKGMYMYYVYS